MADQRRKAGLRAEPQIARMVLRRSSDR